MLGELRALDQALYAAVAGTPTPRLDGILQPLTSAADHSKLWMGTAAVMALAGGRTGRRAAADGLASVVLASLAVNQGFKRLGARRRPDRASARVPEGRWVAMPTSTSFPSGHSASAFAFASGVSRRVPFVGVPLALAATTVAYTRVHSGVHYPGDVVAGSLIGMACAAIGTRALRACPRLTPPVRANEG